MKEVWSKRLMAGIWHTQAMGVKESFKQKFDKIVLQKLLKQFFIPFVQSLGNPIYKDAVFGALRAFQGILLSRKTPCIHR